MTKDQANELESLHNDVIEAKEVLVNSKQRYYQLETAFHNALVKMQNETANEKVENCPKS